MFKIFLNTKHILHPKRSSFSSSFLPTFYAFFQWHVLIFASFIWFAPSFFFTFSLPISLFTPFQHLEFFWGGVYKEFENVRNHLGCANFCTGYKSCQESNLCASWWWPSGTEAICPSKASQWKQLRPKPFEREPWWPLTPRCFLLTDARLRYEDASLRVTAEYIKWAKAGGLEAVQPSYTNSTHLHEWNKTSLTESR